jgi:hypothetical protein
MGQNDRQKEWDISRVEANEAARETELINRKSREKAFENRTQEIMLNVADANRARIASERLRDTSERSLQTARDNHASCIVSASTHAELFDQCRTRYRELGEKAQGHVTDIKALIDSWPK